MSLPVLSVAQMRDWEKATWASGQTAEAVIDRVGAIVAKRCVELTKAGASVLFLAGRGHNGDDARAAARHLRERNVSLLNVTEAQEASGEFAQLTANRRFALIVDGLFGIGLNRPLDSKWNDLIHAINEAGIPILAIDVPSGLDADSGEPQGTAVQASITLTLGAPKFGLLQTPALKFVGRLEVASNIGLCPCSVSTEMNWVDEQSFHGFPPRRGILAHKGDFGHLTIIAGSHGFHGAGVLAVNGALRARPGLVTLLSTEKAFPVAASQLRSAMSRPWSPGSSLPEKTSAILIGPGLAGGDVSEQMRQELVNLWRSFAGPLVADASALDWLPPDEKCLGNFRVITPHPGEAARLLKMKVNDVQKDRPDTVRALSKKFGGCLVVLKGHQTLVGSDSGPLHVNRSGNPGLAQGGSGDVLAGYLAGLLAQKELQNNPLKTVLYAVWQHGATADILEQVRTNWVIDDLVAALGSASAA